MYAAIRQGKARTGRVEELARRIKEGAIPIISDVEGFMAYYVVYAPDRSRCRRSASSTIPRALKSRTDAGRVDRSRSLRPCLTGPATGGGRAGHREIAYVGLIYRSRNRPDAIRFQLLPPAGCKHRSMLG